MAQLDVLTTLAPPISTGEAGDMARRHFGVTGLVRELSSERDRNFHIAAPDGRGYVLKFTNPAEPQAVTDFQTRALLHVAARDASLPVPRIVPTVSSGTEVTVRIDGSDMVLRLLTYMEGTPLHAVQPSSGQMRALGTTLARLDLALTGFDHPGAQRELLWDITRTVSLRERLPYVQDRPLREMVGRFIDRFAEDVLPRLPSLRHQVIHNDLNPHNVVVHPDRHDEVTGIIDFGDSLKAPLVNDLATALAYHVTAGETPFAALADMTGAYHAVLPLTPEEVRLLPDLVAARLVLTICITNWRATEYPDNRAYILRNTQRSSLGLARLVGDEAATANRLLRQACQEE